MLNFFNFFLFQKISKYTDYYTFNILKQTITSTLLSKYSQELSQLLKNPSKNREEDLRAVINIFTYIKNECKKIDYIKGINQAIMMIGNTGNGKSTLLNYLNKEKLFVNEDRRLYCSPDSGIEIGNGCGSTTLLPNISPTSLGNFIDLPGDFQTRGFIGQLFNTLWKSELQLQSFKLVMVVPQDCFGPSGSYGKNFKQMMEKNSKFLGDINLIKESAVMVISFADRDAKNLERAVKMLKNCMDHPDGSLEPYSQFLNFLIKNQRIATFARPSEETNDGDQYSEPKGQRLKIQQAIASVKFTEKPIKFEVSSSPAIKLELYKILDILASWFVHQIDKSVKGIRTIHGLEIRKTCEVLSNINENHFQLDLEEEQWPAKIMNKIKAQSLLHIENIPKDLKESIDCVGKFLKTNSTENIQKIQLLSNDARQNLCQMSDELMDALVSPGENFSKEMVLPHLKISAAFPKSRLVSELMENLKNYTLELRQLNRMQTDSSSKLYEDQAYQQLIRTDKQEYIEQQAYMHPVIKYKDIQYTESVPYTDSVLQTQNYVSYVNEQYKEPVSKTRKATRTVNVPHQVKRVKRVFGIKTKTYYETQYSTVQQEFDQPYIQYETKTRSVPVNSSRTILVPVTKYKTVKKTKKEPFNTTEVRYRNITKQRKVPVYETRIRRKFLEQKYKKMLKSINIKISETNSQICSILQTVPCHKNVRHVIEQFKEASSKNTSKEYLELLKKWSKVEVWCYFDKYPQNVL